MLLSQEKDWRFGWWDGKTVEVHKMEEKPVEEQVDERELRLQEHREFIRQMKERRERLNAEMKAKNIKVDHETGEENIPDTKIDDSKEKEIIEDDNKREQTLEGKTKKRWFM